MAVLSVRELMRAGELLASSTFQTMKVFTLVGVIYLSSATSCRSAHAVEKKLRIPASAAPEGWQQHAPGRTRMGPPPNCEPRRYRMTQRRRIVLLLSLLCLTVLFVASPDAVARRPIKLGLIDIYSGASRSSRTRSHRLSRSPWTRRTRPGPVGGARHRGDGRMGGNVRTAVTEARRISSRSRSSTSPSASTAAPRWRSAPSPRSKGFGLGASRRRSG